jgi:hypothetical protein
MSENLLQAALSYYKMGFSIFPCLSDKKPALKWLGFQQERASEDQIRKWWGNGSTSPIAIVTGKISGVVVVDVDDTDVGFKNLANYIPPGIKTPMAKTPSGGYHLFFKLPEVEVRNNARAIPGCDFRGEGGYVIASPSFCSYEKGNKKIEGFYAWVENQGINDLALNDLNALYISFINSFYYKGVSDLNVNESAQVSDSQHKSVYFTEGRRDEDLFHVANSLVKGHCKITREVLEIIANSCNPPFPQNEIDIKIKSAIDRSFRKEKNIAQDFRDWIKSAPGQFKVSEYYNESAIVSKEDKHAVIIEAAKLVKAGELENVGVRRGEYRVKENDVEIIDWKNAANDEYEMRWPLNLQELVKLYPGNIAVVAGASNTGKTSFMLELIRLNQAKKKITYFNSEMAASELRLRLLQFAEICPISKWDFRAVERSQNFADVVDPDGMNVIDFLEVYDEFWKIGAWIRDIHQKLNTGIAVIAIQKKASTKSTTNDFGRGGELTLEKPRLYLSMDRGTVKIIKGKIWRKQDINPNGLTRQFKLIGGWKFLPQSEWLNDEGLVAHAKIEKYNEYGIGKIDKDFPHEP